MAQDLFCGFCHLRELDYRDKQIEKLFQCSGQALVSQTVSLLTVGEGRKDTGMRVAVYPSIRWDKFM